MTTSIIVTFCILLLIAYVFDLTSSKTKIPSAILLLLLGWIARQVSEVAKIQIPMLTPLLPVLGTVGLILIVLEGSLELELNASKAPIIKKSVIVALVPLFVLSFLLAYFFNYFGNTTFKDSLGNAIPLCVISSSIAIPSVRNIMSANKEFIIYESSLSDIFGVIFFNFVVLNSTIGANSFGIFFLDILIIIIISFVATLGLAYLLSKIDHPIKFAPIILLVILIYVIAKEYHLPALIFILIFGLFLGNLDELKWWSWINKLKPQELNREVNKFKELTMEATFLIRTLFFILFGYLIETREILNTHTLLWAVGIVAGIFIIRAIILKLTRLPLTPLLFIAPRGLITILLFFAISPQQSSMLVNKSLIIQIILLTALVMMFGLMKNQPKNTDTKTPETFGGK
jgi:cell volume regulation protein A